MPVNKVVYGNTTVIDLTDSTLSSADQLASGVTAYDRSGTKLTGTGGSTPYVLVTGEQDAGGGKIIHITGAVNETITADSGGGDMEALSATVLLDISDDTVDAAHLLSGYTAHNSLGQAITGTAALTEIVDGTATDLVLPSEVAVIKPYGFYVPSVVDDPIHYDGVLQTADLSVTEIGAYAFYNNSLASLTLRANQVVTLGDNALARTPIADGMGYIYVPSDFVSAYQSDSAWSQYSAQIRAL